MHVHSTVRYDSGYPYINVKSDGMVLTYFLTKSFSLSFQVSICQYRSLKHGSDVCETRNK
jgi:hypothetical protein